MPDQYLIIGVETNIPWPADETWVKFEGHDFLLRPSGKDPLSSPCVLFKHDSAMPREEELEIARRFMSALSWSKRGYVREESVIGSGLPVRMGRAMFRGATTHHFSLDHLPAGLDPNAKLALAFYREAVGLNSKPYQLLGYVKILNILYPTPDGQIAWINTTVPHLKDPDAVTRIAALQGQALDVGQYLYGSGRCAVAHASLAPVVDPDRTEDVDRMQMDLPVARALAEYAIEHELHVLSSETIRRMHLYELDGFRQLLGEGMSTTLKSGAAVSLAEIPALPRITLRVRGLDQWDSFRAMGVALEQAGPGWISLLCDSGDGLLRARVVLNFAEERLFMDPIDWIDTRDDGTPQAIDRRIDRIRMLRGLLLNGELEAWNSENQTLLGRTDPYVFTNVDLARSVESLDGEVGQLEQERTLRAAGGG